MTLITTRQKDMAQHTCEATPTWFKHMTINAISSRVINLYNTFSWMVIAFPGIIYMSGMKKYAIEESTLWCVIVQMLV